MATGPVTGELRLDAVAGWFVTSSFDAVVAAMASAPVGVMLTAADDRQTVLWVNEAFERITGFAGGNIVGGSPRQLQGPETSKETFSRMLAALEAGRPAETVLISYRRNGVPFALRLRVVPFPGGPEDPRRWIWFLRDVTDEGAQEGLGHQL